MYDDRRFYIPLPAEDCLRLLRSTGIGRVVYTEGALPAITPVNYAVDQRNVVFRTARGSRLSRATDGSVVAFQADEIDTSQRTGWSVVVTGMATIISDLAALERAQKLRLEPWVPGQRGEYMCLLASSITGRRLLTTGLIEQEGRTFGP